MLIIVVAIFAILWLPHRGLLVYNTLAAYYHFPLFLDLWFLMFAKTCIYINRLSGPYDISLSWGKERVDWSVQTSVFNVLYLRLDSLVFYLAP